MCACVFFKKEVADASPKASSSPKLSKNAPAEEKRSRTVGRGRRMAPVFLLTVFGPSRVGSSLHEGNVAGDSSLGLGTNGRLPPTVVRRGCGRQPVTCKLSRTTVQQADDILARSRCLRERGGEKTVVQRERELPIQHFYWRLLIATFPVSPPTNLRREASVTPCAEFLSVLPIFSTTSSASKWPDSWATFPSVPVSRPAYAFLERVTGGGGSWTCIVSVPSSSAALSNCWSVDGLYTC